MKTLQERLEAVKKIEDHYTKQVNDRDYLPIVLFGNNGYYEAYGDSAEFVAKTLNLPLCQDEPLMTAFPAPRLMNWGYMQKLTGSGYYGRIIILDEMATPPPPIIPPRFTDLLKLKAPTYAS